MKKICESNFNYESVLNLIKSVGDSEVIKQEEGKFILIETKSVKPFQELFTLGEDGAYWCFCALDRKRAENYYKQYVHGKRKQYILFNFLKNYSSPMSIVAFTTCDTSERIRGIWEICGRDNLQIKLDYERIPHWNEETVLEELVKGC